MSVNMVAPSVISIGEKKPWFPPQDFAVLARTFAPDGEWRPLLRGIHYRRTDLLMRRHLSRWAREHDMQVETMTIRSKSDLEDIDYRRGTTFCEQLEQSNIELAEDESPGLLVRFRPALEARRAS